MANRRPNSGWLSRILWTSTIKDSLYSKKVLRILSHVCKITNIKFHLGLDSEDKLPKVHDVVDFSGQNNEMVEVDGRNVWIIRQYKILNKPRSASPPSTPSSSSSSATQNQPTKPLKRTLIAPDVTPERKRSSPSSSDNDAASGVRRTLFGQQPVLTQKETHKIKDLNPYQNKYTIK